TQNYVTYKPQVECYQVPHTYVTQKPIFETHYREQAYVTYKPCYSTYEVPVCYTTLRPTYQTHCRQVPYTCYQTIPEVKQRVYKTCTLEPVWSQRQVMVRTGHYEERQEYIPGPVITRYSCVSGPPVFDPCTCTCFS